MQNTQVIIQTKNFSYMKFLIQNLAHKGIKHFRIPSRFLQAKNVLNALAENIEIDFRIDKNETKSFEHYLVFHHDVFFDIDIDLFIKASQKHLSIALYYEKGKSSQKAIEINSDFDIISYGKEKEDVFIYGGICYISQQEIKKLDAFIDDSENLFKEKIKAIPCGGKYSQYNEKINYQKKKPCLFLDRDGVIIHDKRYAYKSSDIEIYNEIISLIKWAKAKDWFVIAITNQSGIARGYFTEDDFYRFTDELNKKLQKHNVSIDKWYFCPFHEKGDGAYRKKSLLRKPWPGMVLQAMNEFPIDIQKSIMVGDKESDQLYLPGLTSYLIERDYPFKEVKNRVFSGLYELVQAITSKQ